MQWRKISQTCLESIPPTHTVAKYRVVRDGELVWVYQAIRLGSPSQVLLQADTAQACKAACRD